MSGTHRLLKGGGATALIADCQYCRESEFPPTEEPYFSFDKKNEG